MGFTMEEYDLRDSFKTEKTLLTLMGFYPRRTQRFSMIYTKCAFFNLFVAYGQIFSMVVQMFVDRNNLSKLSETLLFLITYFTCLCKLNNFEYYKKKILDIEDTIAEAFFYGHPPETLNLLKAKIESCQSLAKIYRFMCVFGILFYALVPFLDGSENKNLILPRWFPYDTNKYYYFAFAFQLISLATSVCNNSSIDILTCMLITVASGEFDILKENLKNINYKVDKNQSVKVIEEKFNHCVKHHEAVVKLAYKVEDMFSKGIFLQFFASVGVICFTGFRLTVIPIYSFQFIFLVMYFLCMMCQLGMYCWYGNDIITTSNSIGQSFYMSNWYEADLKIRKNMIIFLERTQKPVVLFAGEFVPLSLTTFTAILRSSYSYFTVLQQLYSEQK